MVVSDDPYSTYNTCILAVCQHSISHTRYVWRKIFTLLEIAMRPKCQFSSFSRFFSALLWFFRSIQLAKVWSTLTSMQSNTCYAIFNAKHAEEKLASEGCNLMKESVLYHVSNGWFLLPHTYSVWDLAALFITFMLPLSKSKAQTECHSVFVRFYADFR